MRLAGALKSTWAPRTDERGRIAAPRVTLIDYGHDERELYSASPHRHADIV
jgi:hypothetical protein